jgi:long-subunit acyl-CoA synthetase (AMP-forming)
MICVTSAVSPGLCGDFTPKDRHLAVLPMQHIFALCKVRSIVRE